MTVSPTANPAPVERSRPEPRPPAAPCVGVEADRLAACRRKDAREELLVGVTVIAGELDLHWRVTVGHVGSCAGGERVGGLHPPERATIYD